MRLSGSLDALSPVAKPAGSPLDGKPVLGQICPMIHRFECRVYYEDTDLAGIVYYANYLRFIERARSEMLRELGIDQAAMKAQTGVVFAVRQVRADYLAAARYDDLLTVETRVLRVAGARVVLGQDVVRGGETLFSSEITIVALKEGGLPARLPEPVRAAFGGIAHQGRQNLA